MREQEYQTALVLHILIHIFPASKSAMGFPYVELKAAVNLSER